MSEEHKSLKSRHYGSSYDGKVSLLTSAVGGDQITVRFPGIPTEIEYNVPPGLVLDTYERVHDEFSDKLDQLHKAQGQAVYKKGSSLVSGLRYKIYGTPEIKELDEKFKAEAGEIIEHFESMMKAMLVDYAAERYKILNTAITNMGAEVHKYLNNAIAHGESALPPGDLE